jgi:hypothetical protein
MEWVLPPPIACLSSKTRLSGSAAEPLQSLPKQGLHAAGDIRFVEERLGRFRIMLNEVVEIFDLVA